MAIRFAINGFGRIGRVFLRAALKDEEFWRQFELVAVNDIADARTLAHLLKYDSIHGVLPLNVRGDSDSITVDGSRIEVLNERDPSSLPWGRMQASLVLESTGLFRDRANASRHLEAGAKKVVISAPAREPDVTVVLGVNEGVYDAEKHSLISMASCTTGCLAPMVKVLDDEFGVQRGFMTTCHSYTNDQRVLDLPHRDPRRARAASLSIIPTSTGAARAIGKVLPSIEGKLDGMALRVPVADGSIVDLVAQLSTPVSVDDVNGAFRRAASGELKGILDYTEEPLVSVDIIGNPHSCIIDGQSTISLGGKNDLVKVLGWYDNEWGYCSRLVDLFKFVVDRGL
ncbi:MAG: type I glyceraldehyde-3-phosphate dehydrogenase [Candidatus Geothermarchaeales archaeon]